MVYREPGESRGAFELFYSYRNFFDNSMIRQNILNNVWLFVPLGAALCGLGKQFRWPAVTSFILAIGFSIIIEAVQWFTGIGLSELDDVVSNGLGALFGYGLAMFADLH